MKCEIKYAPQQLSEVIYPSAAVGLRINAYATGALSDNIILWGPNGTGKSTVARLLIKAIGGEDALVETLPYDDLVRKTDLRIYLMQAAHMAKFTTSGKYFLLFEEFDNETKKMDKLWTAMDACGDGLMTIFTTNKPLKIDPSLRSRMKMVEFPALTPASVVPRAQYILAAEGLVLPDAQVLHYLAKMAVPQDWRQYMRVLDDLLMLHRSGMQLPAWQPAAPAKPIKPVKPKLSIVK
jgi:replication-associated recombination protein RarA